MVKIKIKKDALEFLRSHSAVVDSGDARYMHLHFWIREIDFETIELIPFDNLPKDLVNAIKEMR